MEGDRTMEENKLFEKQNKKAGRTVRWNQFVCYGLPAIAFIGLVVVAANYPF